MGRILAIAFLPSIVLGPGAKRLVLNPRGQTPRARRSVQTTPLSAIENLIAQISHRQNRVVGSAPRLRFDPGIFPLADEDRVIALFDRIDQLTLDVGRCLFQDRRAQTAFAKRLATDCVAFALERLEESKRLPFLIFTENIEGE